jgi:hypothetical protein
MADQVFATSGDWALASDGVQWMLMRRRTRPAGAYWQPVSFVRSTRDVLAGGGDGVGWQLVVVPEKEISALQWTWFKKRLAFCELTQDGDSEGCFRLSRLPTPAEAEEVRDIVGIRKRRGGGPVQPGGGAAPTPAVTPRHRAAPPRGN